ncbi:calmodulin-binding transcription activator 1 isoform X17 [Castor canadensis]|uniref:Calmodulin-binding transcription activator 1 isoform X17 n=1 Tax=Castor canadensis TaxID=51338 RepID=A0AC58N7D9_CASCN
MWRAEGKWLPKTSRKSVSQSVFCGTSTYCVLNTVPPIEDDHGNSNSSHVKIFLPKKLLECLPKCSSLPKERHRWNTNETAEWLNDSLQQEESEIQERWVLLEKEERWENDQRGPHETQGPGSRVLVRLLCPFLHHPHLPPEVLLAPSESRHCTGPLPERARHRGLRQAMRPHPLLHQHRQEGMGKMDKGGAHRAAEAHVPWHQVDLQQWKQQLGLLSGAAGAADPRQPPDQAPASDPQLPLHRQLGSGQ